MAYVESLSRRQIANRYGICRTAVYGWTSKGILPPADIVSGPAQGRGSRSRWSTSLLARWERANAPILQRMGVYMDTLPPLNHSARQEDQGRTRRGRSTSTSEAPVLSRYAQAIVLLTQATSTVAKAAGSSRVLTTQELRKVLNSLEETRWRLRPPPRE